jgi:hypothetical protein
VPPARLEKLCKGGAESSERRSLYPCTIFSGVFGATTELSCTYEAGPPHYRNRQNRLALADVQEYCESRNNHKADGLTAGNKGQTLPPKAVRFAACFPSRDTHIKERSAHCAHHAPQAPTEKPKRLAVATTFVFVPMEGGTGVLGGARSPHWSPTLAEK